MAITYAKTVSRFAGKLKKLCKNSRPTHTGKLNTVISHQTTDDKPELSYAKPIFEMINSPEMFNTDQNTQAGASSLADFLLNALMVF